MLLPTFYNWGAGVTHIIIHFSLFIIHHSLKQTVIVPTFFLHILLLCGKLFVRHNLILSKL